MMGIAEHVDSRPEPSLVRTVALVGRYAHQLLHTTLPEVDDFEVCVIESIAHAYTKIKRVRPDLVVVCLASDDADACRVLSMLAMDRDTAQIPVVTYFTGDGGGLRGCLHGGAGDEDGGFSLEKVSLN